MMSPVTFFAPSFVFLAPRTFAFRGPVLVVVAFLRAAEDVVRLAAGAALPASGEVDLAIPFPLPLPLALLAFKKGDAVRLTTGGVAVLEIGGVGRLIAGLSQEEKKSSSGSPTGVDDPSVGALLAASVMTTSSGYLT